MTPHAAPLPLPPPELSVYRNHCVALLRRYFSMSVEVGRLPAILGRELFTTRSETYHTHSFEDTVVFVIDVEHCLDRLHPFDKQLIAHIVLQEYTEDETARLLGCGLRTVERRLPEALDCLTEMFLKNGMLVFTPRASAKPAESDDQPVCRRRLPKRANHAASQTLQAGDSQLETDLVKPPFPPNSLQAAGRKGEIIVSDVAGLPLPMCYSGYVI